MRAFCFDLHVEFRWGFLSSVRFGGSVLSIGITPTPPPPTPNMFFFYLSNTKTLVMTRGQISAEQLADVFRVTESEEGHRLVESDFGLPLLKNSGSTSAMGSVL